MTESGDLMLARIVATYAGQPIVNTFGFQATTPFATWADASAALLDQVDTAIGILSGTSGLWVQQHSADYVTSSFDVVDVLPAVAPQASYSITASGATGDDGMPPNDALCITWRTETKGAKARGRTYWNGLTELNTINGIWNTTVLDAAGDVATAMLSAFGPEGSGTFTLVVLHRHDTAGPVVPPVAYPITSFTTHPEVRSLGRRAVGRRIHRTRPTP